MKTQDMIELVRNMPVPYDSDRGEWADGFNAGTQSQLDAVVAYLESVADANVEDHDASEMIDYTIRTLVRDDDL